MGLKIISEIVFLFLSIRIFTICFPQFYDLSNLDAVYHPTLKYLINGLDGINEHDGVELFVCYISNCKQEKIFFVYYIYIKSVGQKLEKQDWLFQ